MEQTSLSMDELESECETKLTNSFQEPWIEYRSQFS